MSLAVGIVIRLLGLFGVSLSPFWGGAIVAGAIAVTIGGAGLHLYNAGYASAETKCEAAELRQEKLRLEARLAEKERQLAFVNAAQQRDAERAASAETRLQKNEEAIDATPANSQKCFDRAMSRRMRDVR